RRTGASIHPPFTFWCVIVCVIEVRTISRFAVGSGVQPLSRKRRMQRTAASYRLSAWTLTVCRTASTPRLISSHFHPLSPQASTECYYEFIEAENLQLVLS